MQLKTFIAIASLAAMGAVPATHAADDHKGHEHGGKSKNSHTDNVKPAYGGVVTVVNDIAYELVAKPDTLTLYVADHGKPMDTHGMSANATLVSASAKADVALAPAGQNKLEAKGAFSVSAGTKALVRVTQAGKPAQNVRFTLK
ncbi:hypothetical protein [Noviherbaspirillum galbum]|uniref:Copper chaperone PCu(A)C n=1 Tax=Noviherbaspirillum galbum TaxID=2709383 RepID=A0A6B3SRJ3_9BURK|nr:hypothetical protein [Noviherbaspirillum galbum]NEX63314.1 hypothetical protein [Noviherbaspirillum galbum]